MTISAPKRTLNLTYPRLETASKKKKGFVKGVWWERERTNLGSKSAHIVKTSSAVPTHDRQDFRLYHRWKIELLLHHCWHFPKFGCKNDRRRRHEFSGQNCSSKAEWSWRNRGNNTFPKILLTDNLAWMELLGWVTSTLHLATTFVISYYLRFVGNPRLSFGRKLLWSLMILTALGTASYFIHWFINGFLEHDVSTTIESTTAPLSEVWVGVAWLKFLLRQFPCNSHFKVHFPAVTICNDNQIRRSFLTDLRIYDDLKLSLKFAQQYILGERAKKISVVYTEN